MTQMLLFPDPRPLVERLGAEFFRQAPQRPGVYLMRDAVGTVLYVGKAKNLRKRLASYRVANPDRMPRRHLRLLRAVVRIELEECAHESSALAREAELLRVLRPRYNRAGTWPGTPRFLGWRMTAEGLEFAVVPGLQSGWRFQGPMGAGAIHLRAALLRLLWCALHPQRGLKSIPEGWFRNRRRETITIPRHEATLADFQESQARLSALFDGHTDEFADWVRDCTSTQTHPFEVAVRKADLETVTEFTLRPQDAVPQIR
jgi:predicted GIY-YIG superfamily endonuclease